MRIVFALVLILGVALAGGAVYFAGKQFTANASHIAELKKRVANNVELIDVYVAAENLSYGKVLTKEDVKIIEWPANSIPETAFSKAEDLFGLDGETDFRTVVRAVDAGEILLSTKVTGLGEDASVASSLSDGMRAFTLRVDVASGVSGFLRPGDKIDIYWTGRVGESTVTRLIMDEIALIAIDQSASSQTQAPTVAKTVTVAVSPHTVAALAQAQSTGNLLLSLRGVNDETNSENIEVTQNDLLGRVEAQAVVKEVEKVCTIKTRKGAEVIQVPIPCSD
ncbi:Flp pilus assembly protein CpaB [Amylibacter sp. SFDW26]|uniref:Flp pilus assembly protein CpaB n=1 Tax=Amylibacter sp. SFDW26 TaxID=2652722 RepID=UPI0012620A92|nr:Flp pilus assembly protein CpaB [Amylibacter sp. SFDW26]KAB7613475.1 Flp pilus assembly protein CpaB [Amylibacter sp. SFDW26]